MKFNIYMFKILIKDRYHNLRVDKFIQNVLDRFITYNVLICLGEPKPWGFLKGSYIRFEGGQKGAKT